MPKRKISATVSPERIRRAQQLRGNDNLSDLIEQALEALVERELERRWISGYERRPVLDDLPTDVLVDLSAVPWEPQP